MGAVLAFSQTATRSEVEVAWATYRALVLATVDDPNLQHDPMHQLAIAKAKAKFENLYVDWTHS